MNIPRRSAPPAHRRPRSRAARLAAACAGVLACTPGWLAIPLAVPLAAPLAVATPTGSAVTPPTTTISVNGNGGNRVFDGVGAVLGGGGNARYLMDYPRRRRDQILNYLFKPDYGANLQILKLEIGGDANSSSGSEPSIEHVRGHLNCHAGYELSIAKAAVARNPHLALYGLQWAAPGWVKNGSNKRFTSRDIRYLLDWLGCARQRGLSVSYLGGWDESDGGTHQAWFRALRAALNSRGYRRVQIVAADSRGRREWHYVGDRAVAILGAHDSCGGKTGQAGPQTTCTSPWSMSGQHSTSQPMWASELGGMDGGAQPGCLQPCAPAMDRGVLRGYVDARLTGFLEWPVLDAMPPGLPYENRGLVTADQPWAGSYRVNAMTWAIAQLTQFAQAPTGQARWEFLNSASGLLDGHAADGSYVTLIRHSLHGRHHDRVRRGTAWTTIIEATTATGTQRAQFRVTGGARLADKTVHVRASDFDQATGSPARWFVREPDIHPAADGTFSLTIRPGWVYSLSSAGGQHKGSAHGRAAGSLRLPLRESLASSGRAGQADDEPPYLAAQNGAFELASCAVPDGRDDTCTQQDAAARPVFWHSSGAAPDTQFPYAIIGSSNWTSYKVSANVLLASRHGSAGLIGRFSCQRGEPDTGQFDGYVFNIAASGDWQLVRNANPAVKRRQQDCQPGPTAPRTLASGKLPRRLRPRTWHRLSLAMTGSQLTATIDGTKVATVTDPTWSSGLAGLEAGAFTAAWPKTQYSHLSITRQRS